MTITKEQKRRLLQELATPPDFWQVVDDEFSFQIDVCAGRGNTKCEWFIDKEIDALATLNPWVGPAVVRAKTRIGSGYIWKEDNLYRAWCNPGFAKVLPWHQKAYAEAQRHPSAVVVVIGIPGGSQDWWDFAYQHATEVRTLKDRVQYITPPGIDDNGNSRESWLFIYRRKVVPCPAHIVHDDWRARIRREVVNP